MKTAMWLGYSSSMWPDGQVLSNLPENKTQTWCLYLSFWQDKMSNLVCVCFSLIPPDCYSTGGLPVCNTDVSFSLHCMLYFWRCFGKHMFTCETSSPFSQHLLVLCKQSSAAPQIWGTWDFHSCQLLFQPVCPGEHGLQIM